MSKEAGDIIQKFYLKLRDHNTSADSTPITARQLESLVRLAQARARVDLREEITVQDAMVSQNMHMFDHTLDLASIPYMYKSVIMFSDLYCWKGKQLLLA